MTDIRLIVIDLDGTLLDSRKQIHPLSARAIQQVRNLGIPVVLATGRTFRSAAFYAKRLALDTPIIAHAGAFISTLDESKPWREVCIEPVIAADLLATLEKYDFYIKVYVGDQLYVEEDTEATAQFSVLYHVPYTAVGKKNLSRANLKPHKIAIIGAAERIAEAFKLIAPWQGYCDAIHDSPNGIEIVAAGVSKGDAMLYICERLGIPLSKVMAFGNEGNDISMVKLAGIGVAMGNSYERLKEVADIMAKSNEELGVADILDRYLIKPQL